MSKITFVNNGTVAQSIQKHMSGRLEIAPGETYELILTLQRILLLRLS